MGFVTSGPLNHLKPKKFEFASNKRQLIRTKCHYNEATKQSILSWILVLIDFWDLF